LDATDVPLMLLYSMFRSGRISLKNFLGTWERLNDAMCHGCEEKKNYKKRLPLGEGSNASECGTTLLQIIRLLPRKIGGKEEAVEVGLALRHEMREL